MVETRSIPSPLMNGEKLFSFSELAKRLPGYRGNGHVNASTIFRWATKGVRTSTGNVIKLEAIRLGSSWKSSFEAVARFTERLTAEELPPTVQPVSLSPTPKQRELAALRASREADAIFGCD